MSDLSRLQNLFLSLLTERVQPLYDQLISQQVLTPQDAREEIHRYYQRRRPGLQEVYSRFSQHWQALHDLESAPDYHFQHLVDKYSAALARYYDTTDLSVEYYRKQWREHSIDSHPWQDARIQFIARFRSLLSNREYSYQLHYIDTLVDEYVRQVAAEVGQTTNTGARGVDAAPRLSWLAAHQDPELRARLIQLTRIVSRNPIARELLQYLGRQSTSNHDKTYQILHASRFALTFQHAGHSDIVGITHNGELAHALPSELAHFADPTLSDAFLARLADGHLQSFDSVTLLPEHARATRQRGNRISNPLGRGPFVVCVDCSGSMSGDWEDIAKALVLVATISAERQQCRCSIILFSDQIQQIDVTSLSHDMEDLRRFLTLTFHGGTDPALAISTSLTTLEREDFDIADFLLLSDCQMPAPTMVLHQRIQQLHARGTRFFTVAFGDDPADYYLDMADHYWTYR